MGVPEQALGEIPLGFGMVVQDKPSEFKMQSHLVPSLEN